MLESVNKILLLIYDLQHSVRISDLGQGLNSARITSIRALPDADLTTVTGELDEKDREQRQGDHINLEISFAYRALPATSRKESRAQNAQCVSVPSSLFPYLLTFIHSLLVEFIMGLKGVVGVPVRE